MARVSTGHLLCQPVVCLSFLNLLRSQLLSNWSVWDSLEMCGLRDMLGNSLLFACYSNPPGPQVQSLELWPQHPTPTAEGCLLHGLRSWCHETGHQGDSRSPGDTSLSIVASFLIRSLLMNDFLD